MSAPTQPTSTLIVTEAYKQFGIASPTSAQLTRAIDYGIEKVKRDIWAIGKKWRILRTTQYLPVKVGVSRYANPSDFEQDIQEPGMVLLDGDSRRALQTAAAGTATLAAAEPAAQADAEGHLLMITTGTGSGQAEQIDDYNSTTKVATMRANWTTTPAAADTYLLVNANYPIQKLPWVRRALLGRPQDPGRPRQAFEMGAGPTGYIELYPVPDQVYGVKRDYYANLLMVDLTSTLYSAILRNWCGVLTQGVLCWLMSGYDDTRSKEQGAIYGGMLKQLQGRELDEMNESNLQVRMAD